MVTVSHLCSLAVFVVAALLWGEGWPGWADLAWGAGAGLAGAAGPVALYRGLALGPMGSVAAVSAALAAAAPVLVGVVGAGRLPPFAQAAGLALAVGGVTTLALAASPPAAGASGAAGLGSEPADPGHRPRGGIACAVVAGLGVGSFLVGFGQTGPGHILWPLAGARVASSAALLGWRWRRRPGPGGGVPASLSLWSAGDGGTMGGWRLLLLSAALDAAGRRRSPPREDWNAISLAMPDETPASGGAVRLGPVGDLVAHAGVTGDQEQGVITLKPGRPRTLPDRGARRDTCPGTTGKLP